MHAARYDMIRAELEARITSGEWPPGTRVPTEAELARTHGVSRVTVQRAVQELVRRGLVVRYRRRGTFVARSEPERDLLRLVNPHGAGPDIEGRHLVTEARVVAAADAGASAGPAGAGPAAGFAPDTPVVLLRRVKLDAAENPIATERAVIPFALVPRLLEEPLEDLTTVAYFRATGVPIHRSRLYVEPVALPESEAEPLRTAAGRPVFRLRRNIWLADGGLAEVFQSHLLPDQSPFYIEQSLAPVPPPAEESP
ncbi:GntR family transcriptional regulator [Streptomonospora nanhaiensis]|uniref:GntR family transcriptional regulator n=1 Tax=Streptomonospora nanhaiensis TaxID=1323731 RepID=UPI001C395403|nr:GntR family transcriptional regulator [Streptomonospora nanhaiensis]MBV2365722.1 GntR family transcriptional regulator [Streptomonospora nanhaiensis]